MATREHVLDAEVVRDPNARGGVHCDPRADDRTPPPADAWARTLDWFERHL